MTFFKRLAYLAFMAGEQSEALYVHKENKEATTVNEKEDTKGAGSCGEKRKTQLTIAGKPDIDDGPSDPTADPDDTENAGISSSDIANGITSSTTEGANGIISTKGATARAKQTDGKAQTSASKPPGKKRGKASGVTAGDGAPLSKEPTENGAATAGDKWDSGKDYLPKSRTKSPANSKPASFLEMEYVPADVESTSAPTGSVVAPSAEEDSSLKKDESSNGDKKNGKKEKDSSCVDKTTATETPGFGVVTDGKNNPVDPMEKDPNPGPLVANSDAPVVYSDPSTKPTEGIDTPTKSSMTQVYDDIYSGNVERPKKIVPPPKKTPADGKGTAGKAVPEKGGRQGSVGKAATNAGSFVQTARHAKPAGSCSKNNEKLTPESAVNETPTAKGKDSTTGLGSAAGKYTASITADGAIGAPRDGVKAADEAAKAGRGT